METNTFDDNCNDSQLALYGKANNFVFLLLQKHTIPVLSTISALCCNNYISLTRHLFIILTIITTAVQYIIIQASQAKHVSSARNYIITTCITRFNFFTFLIKNTTHNNFIWKLSSPKKSFPNIDPFIHLIIVIMDHNLSFLYSQLMLWILEILCASLSLSM